MSWTRMTSTDMPKCVWVCVGYKPKPYTKNYRQPRNTDSRGNNLPQGRAHQLVSSAKWSALKTQGTLYKLNKLYLGIYSCAYVHITAIHEKKKRLWTRKRARRHIREGLEGGMGREKWFDYNLHKRKKFIKKRCKKKKKEFWYDL